MEHIADAVRAELELLTVPQVCELLQVKKGWIYDEVQAGRFPSVRLGRQLRFRAADIRAYLSGSWQPVPKAEPEPAAPPKRPGGRPRKN